MLGLGRLRPGIGASLGLKLGPVAWTGERPFILGSGFSRMGLRLCWEVGLGGRAGAMLSSGAANRASQGFGLRPGLRLGVGLGAGLGPRIGMGLLWAFEQGPGFARLGLGLRWEWGSGLCWVTAWASMGVFFGPRLVIWAEAGHGRFSGLEMGAGWAESGPPLPGPDISTIGAGFSGLVMGAGLRCSVYWASMGCCWSDELGFCWGLACRCLMGWGRCRKLGLARSSLVVGAGPGPWFSAGLFFFGLGLRSEMGRGWACLGFGFGAWGGASLRLVRAWLLGFLGAGLRCCGALLGTGYI
ncbi:hypothetical protein FNV43_RR20648 [Rhamnella rubrinervis]|uniref:Uncharacterized protein n=1 Tax=Rhamnella rubrinervis TaxID=2594499 RepID=A0A8K0GQN7_9ROSA|nr:hypothetical protein FNV43_RR20648 [Rhamnella rubrinervis]